jgi:protein SCO1
MYFLFFIAAAAVTFSATFARAGEKNYTVTGVIRAPLDRDDRITIAHEAIPGLMPAMTMAFSVADTSEAAALKPGDHVRFELSVSKEPWTVAHFLVVSHQAASESVKKGPSLRRRLREGDAFPELALTTQNNEPFTTADFKGRLTLITFIFSRCPVPEYCPAMAIRFRQIQKAIVADAKLASRVRLLGITLDPEFDRPDILKAYGEAVGADPAIWRFVTGTKEEIATLTKAFAVYTERNGVTLDHTLCTALIGSDGRVIEIWRGNGWRAEEILTAVAHANHD